MKIFAYFFAATLLVGCTSSSPSQYVKDNGEDILINSGNYAALVKRYERQLQEEPSAATRFKLASAHYKLGDAEAAMFQLSQISPRKLDSAELALLRANVFLDQGKLTLAEQHANTAIRKEKGLGEAHNLRGLILAEQGKFADATTAFETARKNHYNDAAVKNNLAMMALLKGDYDEAIDILAPLVQAGRADDKAKANLLLAYAKAGKTRAFSQLLANSENDTYLAEKFTGLRATTLNTNKLTYVEKSASVPMGKQDKQPEPVKTKQQDVATKGNMESGPKVQSNIVTSPAQPELNTATGSNDQLAKLRIKMEQAKAKSAQRAIEEEKQAKRLAELAETKKKRQFAKSRRLVTHVEYKSTAEGEEYIATSDFPLGQINTEYLEKRKKWVFDIEGAKDFTTKRRRYYKEGPAKKLVLGEHENFVRIVLEMRDDKQGKPEVQVKGNKLFIRWKA
ncbi:Flp pilus assembly protein TadD [Grimontia indica]|uniref:Flp pilus assembly protein TadD n=1 Tax=Grimontia indica TaxID=1056512 RepID=R1GRA7_9GAMM|nr:MULTISPECIES: tetratricopeptide repeat protein [Grimontia]EOD78763.1 Flp pilus assembly protein TadD [Grimontia indica]